MDAFLLAAGFGKRLKPLTDELPKPLVLLQGKPLIARNLELLSKAGIKRVVVNTHYLAEKLEKYLDDGSAWGLEVVISRENELLDTGGGLRKAWSNFSSEKILTWNSDVFVDPSFVHNDSNTTGFKNLLAVSENDRTKPLVSLLVRDDSEKNLSMYGSLGISQEGRVVEFLGTRFVDIPVYKRVMYAGISVLSREVEGFFAYNPPAFSLTRDLVSQILHKTADKDSGGVWTSFCTDYWSDIGTIDRLEEASKYLKG